MAVKINWLDIVIHIPINSYTNLKLTQQTIMFPISRKNMERILILNKLVRPYATKEN